VFGELMPHPRDAVIADSVKQGEPKNREKMHLGMTHSPAAAIDCEFNRSMQHPEVPARPGAPVTSTTANSLFY
jgi:hypothetical protein